MVHTGCRRRTLLERTRMQARVMAAARTSLHRWPRCTTSWLRMASSWRTWSTCCGRCHGCVLQPPRALLRERPPPYAFDRWRRDVVLPHLHQTALPLHSCKSVSWSRDLSEHPASLTPPSDGVSHPVPSLLYTLHPPARAPIRPCV